MPQPFDDVIPKGEEFVATDEVRALEDRTKASIESLELLLRSHVANRLPNVARLVEALGSLRSLLGTVLSQIVEWEDEGGFFTGYHLGEALSESELSTFTQICDDARESLKWNPSGTDLQEIAATLEVKILDATYGLQGRWTSQAWATVEHFRETLEARIGLGRKLQELDNAVSTARAGADVAVRAAEASRRAAGSAGVTEIGEHYKRYAKSQTWAANLLRVLGMAAVGITVCIALGAPEPEKITTPEVLHRLALAVPILAMSGYLLAEAGKHREYSQWANTMTVQLRTVEAFIQPLTDEGQDQVRLQLAQRVFGDPPTNKGTAESTALGSLADVLAQRIGK